MMENITKQWIIGEGIRPREAHLPIRQVYVWYITLDRKLIIVSKDGEKWQLPGGKPDSKRRETIFDTAIRETCEETGLDINDDSLIFFGYNHITVIETETERDEYLQVRFYVKSSQLSTDIRLDASREDDTQPNEDVVLYARAVTVDEVSKLIPWLVESQEYFTVRSKGLL